MDKKQGVVYDINVERVSQVIANNFKNITSITDIIAILLEDDTLTDTDRMFSMFSMGRRFENNRLYASVTEVFQFGGKLTDPDEDDEDITFEDEKV
jgi:hypothetical protein